ncbi:hypothetical protein ZWY2020_014848 [Hordeum vulgare]|nr:hypothetical protein ZWY2020_014848 [Hordeum vulgare]
MRARKRVVHVVGRPTSMYEDPTEAAKEEEEEVPTSPPPPKKKKLMGDATPSKPQTKAKTISPKAKKHVAPKPKRTTRDIPAAEKSEGSASKDVAVDKEEDHAVWRKLRPHLPEHNNEHQVTENMKERRDQGLRTWIAADPYAVRRRTPIDARFQTKK